MTFLSTISHRLCSASLKWVNQCDDISGRYVVGFGGILVFGLAELASPEQFSNGPRGHLEDVRDCILRKQKTNAEIYKTIKSALRKIFRRLLY